MGSTSAICFHMHVLLTVGMPLPHVLAGEFLIL